MMRAKKNYSLRHIRVKLSWYRKCVREDNSTAKGDKFLLSGEISPGEYLTLLRTQLLSVKNVESDLSCEKTRVVFSDQGDQL